MYDKLREAITAIELSELNHKKELLAKDLEIEKLTKNNETLIEVIKHKEDMKDEWRKAFQDVVPGGKKKD